VLRKFLFLTFAALLLLSVVVNDASTIRLIAPVAHSSHGMKDSRSPAGGTWEVAVTGTEKSQSGSAHTFIQVASSTSTLVEIRIAAQPRPDAFLQTRTSLHSLPLRI